MSLDKTEAIFLLWGVLALKRSISSSSHCTKFDNISYFLRIKGAQFSYIHLKMAVDYCVFHKLLFCQNLTGAHIIRNKFLGRYMYGGSAHFIQ